MALAHWDGFVGNKPTTIGLALVQTTLHKRPDARESSRRRGTARVLRQPVSSLSEDEGGPSTPISTGLRPQFDFRTMDLARIIKNDDAN